MANCRFEAIRANRPNVLNHRWKIHPKKSTSKIKCSSEQVSLNNNRWVLTCVTWKKANVRANLSKMFVYTRLFFFFISGFGVGFWASNVKKTKE